MAKATAPLAALVVLAGALIGAFGQVVPAQGPVNYFGPDAGLSLGQCQVIARSRTFLLVAGEGGGTRLDCFCLGWARNTDSRQRGS